MSNDFFLDKSSVIGRILTYLVNNGKLIIAGKIRARDDEATTKRFRRKSHTV